MHLEFDFPLYGTIVRQIMVSPSGFVFVANETQPWLGATQFIAPFWANFGTQETNMSTVKYNDNGKLRLIK